MRLCRLILKLILKIRMLMLSLCPRFCSISSLARLLPGILKRQQTLHPYGLMNRLQNCPLTLVLKTYLKVVLASGLMEMEMSSSRDVRLKEAGDYLCLEIA